MSQATRTPEQVEVLAELGDLLEICSKLEADPTARPESPDKASMRLFNKAALYECAARGIKAGLTMAELDDFISQIETLLAMR